VRKARRVWGSDVYLIDSRGGFSDLGVGGVVCGDWKSLGSSSSGKNKLL